MKKEKRAALEAAGWRFGNAADFLKLTDDERRLVDLRLAVSRAIRGRREELCLTQKQLAAKLKSSQSRVAKMEAGLPDVSLDLMFRALFAVGGEIAEVTSTRRQATRVRRTRS